MDISNIFYFIGFSVTLYYSLKFIHFFLHFFSKKIDIKTRYYQKDSWAIVTGASDGIGKEFAKKFASLGFNVCLMARNKEKTDNVVKKIQFLSPNIKLQSFICDFKDAGNDDFADKMRIKLLEFEDICILVNNVGLGANAFFLDATWEDMRDMINVNCLPIVLMTKLLSNHLLLRTKPSLIINLSSFTHLYPTPFCSVYGATKAFDDYFSRVLDFELSKKIEILSFKPLFVKTPMTGYRNNFGAISTKNAVEGVLNEIGYDNKTFGHWKHQIISVLFGGVLGCETLIRWLMRNEYIRNLVRQEFHKIKLQINKKDEKFNKKTI